MQAAPISLAGRPAAPLPTTKPKAAPIAAPALIVFGRDDAGKAHASCFDDADADLAAKAAALMGFNALGVTTEAVRVLSASLPPGRVFASGRAFVPFVKASLYADLAAAAGVPDADPETPRPRAAPVTKSAKKQAAGGADAGDAENASANHPLPDDWSKIVAGCLVLASVGESDGWYEAIVVEVKGDDLFVVQWRDWPEDAVLVRRREHLGLLHPQFQAS